ncbi:MAG: ribonuclease R [Pseudomonadota bacterium]
MEYIRDHPDKATKRDIAKAFGIRGDDRIELKRLLRSLADDGLIEGKRKRFTEAGDLPPVLPVTIFEQDSDGDLIAEPVKWEKETTKPPRVLIVYSSRDKGRAPGVGDQALVRITERGIGNGQKPAYAAKIIKILPKRASTLLGVVQMGAHAEALPRLVPVDRKQSECEIDDLGGADHGDLVEATISKIGRYGLQRARVTKRIGSLKSEKAVSQIALHEHDIPHVFPEAVLEAADAAKKVDPSKNREDWRSVPLITIDPADAKDHDDAVAAIADDDPANEGGYIITVAIADVGLYVQPGTPLDREAFNRGNSVYFPDRVIPMLPETISNDLCSLKENKDRPALAVQIWINAHGRKIRHRFHRIFMKSHAALAYEEAQAAIDGKPSERAKRVLESTLRPLYDAYRCLLNERGDRAPLDLNVTERKIRIDEDGKVADVIVPKRLTAHKLIEEFMILANVAAAEALEAKRSPVIFRAHDAPSLAKLEGLRDFLSTIDLQIPKAGNIRPEHFNRILARVKGENHDLLTNQVVLRSQAQAEYTPDNYGHFGLNLKKYVHFTSPIRRYADLMIHRGLITAFGFGEGGLSDISEDGLFEIAEHVSATERRAMAAERATVDRLIAEWLADKVGAAFFATINGVTKAGLFVTLDETGADGFIPISTIGNDYYIFDDARHQLVGERSRETYTLGDKVEVKLVEALPFAGALRFEMLSEGKKIARHHTFPQRKGRRAQTRAKRGGPPAGVSRKIKRKR